MNELPILFSTEMVRANLEGRKTMTRRTRGLEKINENPNDWQFEWGDYSCKLPFRFTQLSSVNDETITNRTFNQESVKCPYGQPDDLLWVRESFCHTSFEYLHKQTKFPFAYKADVTETEDTKKMMADKGWKWKPSIHMPKKAARIWLQVEEVSVERLNEISSQDAIHEGIENLSISAWKDYLEDSRFCSNPIKSFKSLFISINGKPKPQREHGEKGEIVSYSAIAWDQADFDKNWAKYNGIYRNKPLSVIINPWVWVVKYKVLSTKGKPKITPCNG